MRKLTSSLSVVAVLGLSYGAYQLWRAGSQLTSSVDVVSSLRSPSSVPSAGPAATQAAATGAVTAEVTRSDAASVAETSEEPQPGEQFGPNGHLVQEQPRQEIPKTADTPAAASSDTEPSRASEVAALADARATLEALLNDPSPDVRTEAAALLEVLASGPQ